MSGNVRICQDMSGYVRICQDMSVNVSMLTGPHQAGPTNYSSDTYLPTYLPTYLATYLPTYVH